jgi:hypothetical protein
MGTYIPAKKPEFRKSERPTLSLPNHKELAPGLLRAVIRNSGISVEEFLNLLKK